MNHKINYLTRSVVAVIYGMSALAVPAFAQQTTSTEQQVEDVEVIEVTSSRRIQKLKDVPASVITANPAEFIQRGLSSIVDVVDEAPGFSFSSLTGQSGHGAITARGVSQQNDSAVTAIYLDDVPLTSNTGFAGGGRLFFDGLLGDVARVELIKGPQGTLYGATAIAGALRYISNEPELFDARGKFTVDLSQTKSGDLNQLYSGFYSFPLVEGKLGLTVAGYTQDHGGYVDQVSAANGALIRKNANESDASGFSADLYYKHSDDLDVRLKALRQTSSFGLSSAVRLDGLNQPERWGELKSDAAFGSDELTQKVVSASLSYTFDKSVLDVTSSKTEYESANAQDVLSIYGPLIELVGGYAPGSVTSAPLTRDLSSDKTVHEMRLTSTDSGPIEWLAGLYYTSESTQNVQRLVGLPQEALAVAAGFPSEYKEFAAFGNVTYYFNQDFDVTVGLRVADSEQSLIFFQDGFLLGGLTTEVMAPAKATVDTYLFAARYRADADTSYYARIASGYRPAGSNLSVRDPFTGELLSQQIIEQDDLWSYEIGVKGALHDNRLKYESSVYYIDWKNFQSVATFFGITTGGNAQDGITVKGWEGSFDYAVNPQFSVRGGAAYARSTLNSDEPQLFGLKGGTVPNVPRWTSNLSAVYDYKISSDVDGWFNASMRYRGSADSAFSDGNPQASGVNAPSDSFTVVNLTAGAAWNNWTATLYMNNLFDTKAYNRYSANLIPGTSVVSITGIPLEPRKIGISVSYSF
jgi:iron complex outermembrane receptor protein